MAKSLKGKSRQHRDYKKWLKANEEWFKSNPSAFRRMVNDPDILLSLNQHMTGKKGKLMKRIERIEQRKSDVPTPEKKKRTFRLPRISLSTASQNLGRVSELINNINYIGSLFK
ncbi:hypothetical protein [Ammoniphilus resinae]|uniref:Uncharacterized protein n=1 Tax=Ammoniphilus resinae TaxID=861532 RepID=A0ABS4GP57_9BACL|nr:hypothetical protein [Ammoniphilus resinae]MBP1931645.1 hypothetical protein [Ammoniphilus resinae]